MISLILLLLVVIVVGTLAYFYFTQKSTPAPTSTVRIPSASSQYYNPHAYSTWDPATAVQALAAVNPLTLSGAQMKIPPAPKAPANFPIPAPTQPGAPVKATVPANTGRWGNLGFSDPNAIWLGPDTNYHTDGPNGTWSYYKTCFVITDTTMTVHFASDDSGEVWLDGKKIGTHADAWWAVDKYYNIPISAGYHLIKIVGNNLHGGPYGILASFIDDKTGLCIARTEGSWTWTPGS